MLGVKDLAKEWFVFSLTGRASCVVFVLGPTGLCTRSILYSADLADLGVMMHTFADDSQLHVHSGGVSSCGILRH